MVGINLFLNGYLPNIPFSSNINGDIGSGEGKGPFLTFPISDIEFVNALHSSFGLLVYECGR